MKLILHIGTEKTGSSSLQQWGSKNREKLKEHGVFYSESLGYLDHRKASVYARNSDLPDDGFERYKISTVKEHQDFKAQLEEELKKEVLKAKELGCHHFLVSSEHFHSRIETNDMVNEVKKLFEPLFDEIEVLAYIRPQAELFQSRLSVNVRNFDINKNELVEKWKKDIHYFDYYLLWKRWTSAFERVKFKPFNKYKNIVEDVANEVGVNLSDFENPLRVNEKLDYRVGVLIYALNKKINDLSIKRELVDLYIENLPCEKPITISRTLVSQINSFYHDSNLALCKEIPSFTLNYVESNFRKYPVNGTAEKIFEDNDNIRFTLSILIRNYISIHFLRCESQFITIERALARKNIDNARNFKVKLDEMLSKLNGIQFEKADLKDVEHQINQLKNKVTNLKIEG
ncbi:TPA: hypothetical protein NJ263_004531 [Vibrio parahaemolyticus]|nr:hypothetical protein [Vibrio parahaemolyticus]